MSKLAKFRSKHGAPKRNPPIGTDVVEYIVPGFAAFAATRFATRMVTDQISKRYPKYAKHAGAIASVSSFAAAWFGAHRVKHLERFHHPIVVGAGLAALQSLLQLYVPKLGWLVGDPMPARAALPAPKSAPMLASSSIAPEPVPQGFRRTTANEWYAYNDSFDAGSYKGKAESSPVPVPGEEPPNDTEISDLLDNSDLMPDNSDLQLDNSDMGLFS